MLGVFGFAMPPPLGAVEELAGKLDENSQAWHGDDDGSGERKTEVQLLSTVKALKFDSQVFYVISLHDDHPPSQRHLVDATREGRQRAGSKLTAASTPAPVTGPR